jgi:hypothetical protein
MKIEFTRQPLESMAGKFKVPVAVFFLPEPPPIPPISDSLHHGLVWSYRCETVKCKSETLLGGVSMHAPFDETSQDEQRSKNSALASRRDFLKSAVAATVVVGARSQAWAAETKEGIPYRALGRTGVKVSAIGLGGYHIGKKEIDEVESIRIIRNAIDRGITFMDNCWDYNDGASEIRMGKALRDGYRQKAFLMTKVDGRTKEAAASQIDECLLRLQTDQST